jgi:uncharacterized membrane protein HdeD (DUF308 family)
MEQNYKHNRGRIITGVAFILVGALMLLSRIAGAPLVGFFWPFLLIIGGLLFYVSYFFSQRAKGSEGLLFPATYLVILGAMFTFLNLTTWDYMRYLWPTFVFGVAISLAVVYFFTPEESHQQRSGSRSAILTLTVISLGLYLLAAKASILWPMVLIVIGIIVIFGGFRHKRDSKSGNEIS